MGAAGNARGKHVDAALSEAGWELQFRLGAWPGDQHSSAAPLSPEHMRELKDPDAVGLRGEARHLPEADTAFCCYAVGSHTRVLAWQKRRA